MIRVQSGNARCYKYTMINGTANVIMSASINITDSKNARRIYYASK